MSIIVMVARIHLELQPPHRLKTQNFYLFWVAGHMSMSNLMEKKMCHVEIDFLLGVFEKSAHFPSYSERPIGKVENIKN